MATSRPYLTGIFLTLWLTAGSASAAELSAAVQDEKGNPVADAVVIAIPRAGILPVKAGNAAVE